MLSLSKHEAADALRVPAKLLREVGEAIFGPQWQRAMARALDINDRHIRKWASGEIATPTWLRQALIELIDSRVEAAAKVRAELAKKELFDKLGARRFDDVPA